MIVVMITTASVAVAWSMTHIVVLVVDMAALAALRWLSLWEGRRGF